MTESTTDDSPEPQSDDTSADEATRRTVREAYGQVAERATGCCGPSAPATAGSCCGPAVSVQNQAEILGYGKDEIATAPEDANLGLGCGNPTALAALKPGEVVVDLGAGAGLDAFIAAKQVGKEGRVIGIDMTPQMLERARTLAVQEGVARTVEFREGIIEQLPVAPDSVDVIISNCVINLSPDKPQVFREAFRVLKPGGRIAISDIVLTEPLPAELAQLAELYVACLAGALEEKEYLGAIEAAGFVDVGWTRTSAAPLLEGALADPTVQGIIDAVGRDRVERVAETVFSYRIEARKP